MMIILCIGLAGILMLLFFWVLSKINKNLSAIVFVVLGYLGVAIWWGGIIALIYTEAYIVALVLALLFLLMFFINLKLAKWFAKQK